jgi:hypothetical protein
MNSVLYPAYFRTLYNVSGANALGLPFEHFAQLLLRIAAIYTPPVSGTAEFYSHLHIRDLALAQACAEGLPGAWEFFLDAYQGKLHSYALALCRREAIAQDLVDRLITELYGAGGRTNEQQNSKLASYTGRGSLETWLRATIAQA